MTMRAPTWTRWTIRSPDAPTSGPGARSVAPRHGASVALAITLGSALVVVTCNGTRERVVAPSAPGSSTLAPHEPTAATGSSAPALPTAAPASPTAEVPQAIPAARPAGHELDGIYAALRALEQRTRAKHVRIAWLGDSHGASDLWSGPLRDALQERFGTAGPGFIHVGYKAYRHDHVRLDVTGRWAVAPRGPSTSVTTGDGAFGLGGVLLAGSADGPQAGVTVTSPTLSTDLTWDLCVKLGSPRDELTVRFSDLPDQSIRVHPGEPLGQLRHVTWQSAGPSPSLRVMPLGGQPQLCGVVIETDPRQHPGVVLDTLGINGARLTTPLAWAEGAWVIELQRRPPDLVILEYGTNESGDSSLVPAAYVDNLRRLIARVHRASPTCDCLVLAPTDRADTLDRTPRVRDALRDAAKASGCGFWDTYEVMGGKGSIVDWRRQKPPRAGADGVHLTPHGYRALGEALAAYVLAGYRP